MISRYHIDVCVCVCVCMRSQETIGRGSALVLLSARNCNRWVVAQNCGYAHALCLTEVGRGHVMGMKKWGKGFW